ncbi:hypothetical protein HID58_021222 [Brassica napus]|uniref:MMS19 nucleotide excision repair protein n=1 Tax=Brassica napus TaxID=3708 RepID=A0ABQ8CVU7_BRANA|nr:hypothetical protein HID58_021222 [Brassica napus]
MQENFNFICDTSIFRVGLVNFDKDILVQFLCHVISLQGRDDFRITLLQVLECITEDAPLVTQNAEITIREILPSLATIYNENNKDGDDRFLCLKIWFDTVTIFLTECTKIEQQTSDDLKSISNSHFLPLYPALIQYQLYAQKLLVMLFHNALSFFGDLSSANVNNVKLRLALASALEMETKDMEDFLEPPLSLCRAFLPTVTWEQERRKSTELQLLVSNRILHCLGYACKQYLSPAMILSISGHDVYKINAIVSEMKNSDVAGLNSVASLVAVELQRLPR